LEKQADAAFRAASAFHALSADFSGLAEYVTQIDEIEQEGDKLTQQFALKIDSSSGLPISRRDLHALSSQLDDITDRIEATTARIALYRLPAPRPDLEPLAALLVQAATTMCEVIAGLKTARGRESLPETFQRMHQIEHESDQVYRQALAGLLNAHDHEPILVIKWKEIYDTTELAIDKCEYASKIVQSILVRHG
jgi:predicted phosphate transport protein (TIGR00153 family)